LVLGVQVFDLEARRIERASARVNLPGDAERDLLPAGDILRRDLDRKLICDTPGFQSFDVDVAGPSDFTERKIPLLVTRICKAGHYTYKVYLSGRETRVFNSAYVNQVRAILDRRGADAALAYLAPGWDDYEKHSDDKSDYSCRLKHWYATSLHRVCRDESYATCDKADEIYEQLEKWDSCQKLLGLNREYYAQARADVTGKKAQVAAARGDFEGATKLLDAISEAQEKGLALGAIGLTPDRVATFSAFAYLKLGSQKEASSPEEADLAYKNAAKRFALIRNPTEEIVRAEALASKKAQPQ